VELDHLLTDREEADVGPVGLGLDAGSSLEPDLWIADRSGPDLSDLALEGGLDLAPIAYLTDSIESNESVVKQARMFASSGCEANR
jgi:hypothetical protein